MGTSKELTFGVHIFYGRKLKNEEKSFKRTS